jgi:hypothetical protein
MLIHRFRPKDSEVEALHVFDGFVEIQIPSYKERVELIKKFRTTMGGEEITITEEQAIDELDKIIDIAQDKIRAVQLIAKDGAYQFNDLKSLESFNEYPMLIGAIGKIILQGISLGNLQGKG